MKTMKFIFLALIAFQSGCSVERNEIIITGQFLGEFPREIAYTYPVNGTSFQGFVNRAAVDTIGHFMINLQIERPALVNFVSFGSPALIVEPGNTYEILLSRNEHNKPEISGNISEIQKVYSDFPHQHPMSCLYSYGDEVTNYNSIKQKLNDDLEKEVSVLNDYYRQNLFTKDLLNLLVTDRKIYYYTAQSVLSSRNHLEKKSNKEEVPADIFAIWSEAVAAVPLDNELLLDSYYSFDYLKMYIFYKIYMTFDFDEFADLRAQKRANRTTHAHNIELAKEYFTGKVLEFYIAGTFLEQYRRRQYDENLSAIFEQFKSDFPNSEYLPFVEETYANMVEMQ